MTGDKMVNYQRTKNACYLAYITGAVVCNLAPILFVIFMDEFGLSYSQAAVLTGVNFLTQLTVDAVSVRVLSKIGYRAAAVAAHILAAAGLVTMGLFAKLCGFWLMILCVVIYAAGGGLLEVIISPIIESVPSQQKSGQMSLLHSFYCWGQVLTVIVTTVVLKIFGNGIWRLICILWAAIPIVNAVNFLRVPLAAALDEEKGRGVRQLFQSRFFITALILMLASGASELTMSQWASAFAERGLGVPKLIGDLLGPCAFAVLMGAVRALYGVFSSRIKLMPALFASSVLCAVCYLAASLSNSGAVALAGCAVTGASVGLMWPGMLSLMCEKIPDGRTEMFGLAAMAGDIGCALGPWVCGIAADATSFYGAGIFGAQPGIYSGILCGTVFPLIMLAGLFISRRCRS